MCVHIKLKYSIILSRSSNSPESGISTSHTSLPDSDFEHIDADNPDYYEEPLPVLGTCEALYPFEGKTFFKANEATL